MGGVGFAGHLGNFSRICVSMFMFLGGYGIWIQFYSHKLDLISKITGLYIRYWKIFIIYIPVGFCFFGKQSKYCIEEGICNNFSKFDFIQLLNNFIGNNFSYNREWWFLKTYIFSIILGYIYIRLIKQYYNIAGEFFLIVLIFIFIKSIFPSLYEEKFFFDNWFYRNWFMIDDEFISFLMGIWCAKYSMITYLRLYLQRYSLSIRVLFSLNGIGVIFCLRNYILFQELDMIYILFLILFLLQLLDISIVIAKIFHFLGIHSTNIWLIHTFYCYYFYQIQKIIYKSRYWVLILFTLLFVSLLSSVLIDKIYLIGDKSKDKFVKRYKAWRTL